MRILASVIFIVLMAAMLVAVTFVLVPIPGTVAPWGAVTQTRGQCDVIVLGSSRAYSSVLPMELWRDRGITSVDVASGSLSLPATVAFYDAARRSQKPRVVLLEAHMMGNRKRFDMSVMRPAFDYMPYGLPRAIGIARSASPSEWFELYFPIQEYHSRWSALTHGEYLSDKRYRYAFARGAYYLPQVMPVGTASRTADIDPEAYAADLPDVRAIASRAQRDGSQVVVYLAPSVSRDTVGGEPLLDRLERDLRGEYPEIRYVDLNGEADKIGLDTATDYKDESHLNFYGARKTTAYLGALLDSRYGVPDRRTAAFRSQWDADLKLYDDFFVDERR